MSTDVIVLLEDDHTRSLETFKDFQVAGPRAYEHKGDLVDRTVTLLTVHTYLENEVSAQMIEARKKTPTSPARPRALKKTVDAVIR